MEANEEANKALARLRVMVSRSNAILLALLDLRKKPGFEGCALNLIKQVRAYRTSLTLEIGKVKQILDLPIYCPKREEEELALLQTLANGLKINLSAEEIREFFLGIFAESRKAQEEQRAASCSSR